MWVPRNKDVQCMKNSSWEITHVLVNIDKKQEANKNEQVHEAEMPPQGTYNDGMRQSLIVLIIAVEDRPSSVQRKTGT